MPSEAVVIPVRSFALEGMLEGSMREEIGLEGLEEGLDWRCLRISRSSKSESEERSSMSSSGGSLSRSLSLTSSMRACDMVGCNWGRYEGPRAVEGFGGVRGEGIRRGRAAFRG